MEKSGSWREFPSTLLQGGRSPRALRVAAFTILILFLVLVYGGSSSTRASFGNHRRPAEPAATGGVPRPSRDQQRLMDAARNATLGFSSIQFINLPGRF
ncbi:hypothetical protein MY5147_008521, partial [Beauveria neobassiana]